MVPNLVLKGNLQHRVELWNSTRQMAKLLMVDPALLVKNILHTFLSIMIFLQPFSAQSAVGFCHQVGPCPCQQPRFVHSDKGKLAQCEPEGSHSLGSTYLCPDQEADDGSTPRREARHKPMLSSAACFRNNGKHCSTLLHNPNVIRELQWI